MSAMQGIHEQVPIKKIRLWDDSNRLTHAGEPTTSREVVLRSADGANPTVFNLPKEIKYVKSLLLHEVFIPTLFYNITSTQTVVQSNNTGALTSVVVTAGVYTQSDLVALFATAGDTTLTISTSTGLATITFAVSDPNHTVDFTSAGQLQSLLGFTNASNVSATTSVTGNTPANLYPINNIYVRSNALSRLLVDNVVSTTSAGEQDVVFTIPMNQAPSTAYYFYQHPADRRSRSCHGGDMQSIDITFTDETGTVLDFHSQPYFIKFQAETEDFMRR